MGSIRAKVVCVLRNAGRFLLMRITDPHDGRQMLIPPGGGVEFGERLDDAVVREVLEEVGLQISAPRRLGMLENIFSFAGKPEHELIFVYECQCPDARLCAQAEVTITESNGHVFTGVWLTLEEAAATGLQTVPDGLIELLNTVSSAGTR
jgi:ADP-ribose pyrophosphatase YjhB (NUDIX family)